ncbi:unnamed protein product [Oikopleura dioica]|uniref:Uncharacterized protein n=2 Tax=Oikopleura dioica TaxID=34765 RepID=E4YWA7_OIKDI|nr:unnamed protein product [Oikopleura dioica]
MGIFKRQKPQSKEGKERETRMFFTATNSPHPTFDLSGCDLVKTPTGLLSRCKNLQKTTLDLSNNRLKTLDGNCENLDELIELRLANNNFKELPLDASKMKNLRILDLSGNPNFNKIDQCLALPQLRILRLNSTSVTKIPHDIFQRECPLWIDTDAKLRYPAGNEQKVTEKLNQCKTLDSLLLELQLRYCELFIPPENLFNVINDQEKTELDMSHNHLLDFKLDENEAVIRNLRLMQLNLSHNRLTFLPPSISLLESLTELNVSHNDLCILPKELSKMNGLKKLDVSFNLNLFYLPKPPCLLHVNISSTAIQLSNEFKSKIASIVDENTAPVPGISDVVSSSLGWPLTKPTILSVSPYRHKPIQIFKTPTRCRFSIGLWQKLPQNSAHFS